MLAVPSASAAQASGARLAGTPAPAPDRASTAAAPDSATVGPAPSNTVAPDSTASARAAAPASRGGIAVAPPRARRTLPQPGRFDRPRWVMLRSLLVPGWGQAHNRAWVKAALVAVGDGVLRVRFIRDERLLNQLNHDAGGRLGDLTAAIGDTTAAGAEYRAALLSGNQQLIDAAQAALNAANVRVRTAGDVYNEVVSTYNALLGTSVNRRWLLGGVVLYALIDAYVDAHFKSFDINFQFDPALPGGPGTPGARLQIRWAF